MALGMTRYQMDEKDCQNLEKMFLNVKVCLSTLMMTMNTAKLMAMACVETIS